MRTKSYRAVVAIGYLVSLATLAWPDELTAPNEIRFENDRAFRAANGNSPGSRPHGRRNGKASTPGFSLSNDISSDYVFTEITSLHEGYSPSINNLGEIVYERLDPQGYFNTFSNMRGWVTSSTSSSFRGPDVNDSGEVVFCDNPTQSPGGGPFTVWSTVRGSIAPGCWPTISNNGEIVYEQTQASPSSLMSTTRGFLTTLSPTNTSPMPEVGEDGDVVYQDIVGVASQVFSLYRGQITSAPSPVSAGSPTINKTGEIVYTATDTNYGQQLLSTIHGRITDASFFPYPVAPDHWTGLEPYGLYFLAVGYGADINDLGQIVFPVVLAEGPTCDARGCGGIARVRLYLADPVIHVAMDIKPGDPANAVNITSRGLTPVAILTTADFDAKTVDAETVRFGKTGVETQALRSTLGDVNNDGTLDLILNFRMSESGIPCGQTTALLTGSTLSRRPISATDSLVTLRCQSVKPDANKRN